MANDARVGAAMHALLDNGATVVKQGWLQKRGENNEEWNGGDACKKRGFLAPQLAR